MMFLYMKKTMSLIAATLASIAVSGQEIYDNARLLATDLNGTARYVGMGGAMEALGSDISTMGTNPAGIALMRRSSASVSFGVNTLRGVQSIDDFNKTRMSFNQAGFVYSMRPDRSSFVNIGVNYTKSADFGSILTAADRLGNASQNKLSALKNYKGAYLLSANGGKLTSPDAAFSQADYLYANSVLNNSTSQLTDANGNAISGSDEGYLVSQQPDGSYIPSFYNASDYSYAYGGKGYIGQYDFNISGNCHDRVYWGLSFGLYDVHYHNASSYQENLIDGANSIGSTTLFDERKITGTGFDIKAGIIVRPFDGSPLRIAAYVHTPTWYDLNTKNITALQNNLEQGYGNDSYRGRILSSTEDYDYKFYTPWRFGVSLGHTVGNYLAFGATYEYADYSTSDIRVNDGGYYDDFGYHESSSSDRAMKTGIKNVLRGVSTFKVGVEYKVMPDIAVRLGYNYVSPMYRTDGYKDGTLSSPSTYYSSTTDYVNWKATNRLTAGVGGAYRHFTIDLACLYSKTNGIFYPFMSYADPQNNYSLDNGCNGVQVSQSSYRLMLTLGYRF